MTLKSLFDGSYKLAERKLLQHGDSGAEVKLLKRYLFAQGFGLAEWGDFSHEPSGAFDRVVEAHVHQFQTAARLVVDGVVGPKTWRKLLARPAALGASAAAQAQGLRTKILALLRNPQKQTEYRRRGKQAVRQATGSSSNACAATASQPLIELGLLKKPHLMAQFLSDDLENRHLAVRLTSKAQVQPGDLIVCADYNGNGLSDHVWWALSAPNAKLEALCFDNQGSAPTRLRNLDKGLKTEMAYALRFG